MVCGAVYVSCCGESEIGGGLDALRCDAHADAFSTLSVVDGELCSVVRLIFREALRGLMSCRA